MRRGPALLLLLVAAPALAAPGSTAPPRRANPYSVREEVDRAERRLQALLDRARLDWRMAKVEKYLSFATVEDFTNPKRDVHVTDLVAILADESAPADLRNRARDALTATAPRTLDPDLSVDPSRSRRAPFTLKHLVPLLVGKDPKTGESTRKYVKEVLDSLWHYATKAISVYEPADPATWKAAQDDWRKFLGGR